MNKLVINFEKNIQNILISGIKEALQNQRAWNSVSTTHFKAKMPYIMVDHGYDNIGISPNHRTYSMNFNVYFIANKNNESYSLINKSIELMQRYLKEETMQTKTSVLKIQNIIINNIQTEEMHKYQVLQSKMNITVIYIKED